MRTVKLIVKMTAMLAVVVAPAEDTAPFRLDTVTPCASPAVTSLSVLWDATWIGGDVNATVVVADNGTEVRRVTGTGEFTYAPSTFGRHELTYTTYIGGVAQRETYSTTFYSIEWKYKVQGGGAVITETGHTAGAVTIPDKIDGYFVTGIDSGVFQGCTGLTSVTVPSTVKNIGANAFAGCKNLKLVFQGVPPEVVGMSGNVIDPDTNVGGGVFGPYDDVPSEVRVFYLPEFVDAWGGEQCSWCGAWAGCGPDVTISPGDRRVFSGSVSVSIASSWTNAVIHYTADGVEPTEASPVYKKPLTVNRPCTIRARAFASDWGWGPDVSAQFGYGRTANPQIASTQGTTFRYRDNMVTFSCDTTGAEFTFTLDGSDPRKGGIVYPGPLLISTSVVVRVVARSADNVDSDVVEQAFTRVWETVATPRILTGQTEPAIESVNLVTITCATEGAGIYYSTGGNFTAYTGPFRIFDATQVRAYAVKDDWLQSATAVKDIPKTWNDGGVVGLAGKVLVSTTSAQWREDKTVSYSGGSSLRSGEIGNGGKTDLKFSVTGKGTVLFHWRASCEGDPYMHATDYVRFCVDGVEKGRLDGISGWESFSTRIDTAGQHVLTWEYVKDGSDSDGEDCAWVDDVAFKPDAMAWIRFDGNGNTSGKLPDAISHYLGEKVTLPAQGTLVRDRYDFTGWSDGEKVYAPLSIYAAPDTDVTLLAAWMPRLAEMPVIHVAERYEGVATTVRIAAVVGAAIYYTTDGSDPTEASSRYSGEFKVSGGTTTIKAIAISEGRLPSGVATATTVCLWRNATEDGVLWYYTADGTLVSGVGLSGKAVLPSKLGGVPIVKLGESLFSENSKLVAIVVPEGIVEMEDSVFYGCSNLETVVLPSTLKRVGEYCFWFCEKLSHVYWCMRVSPVVGSYIYLDANLNLISHLPWRPSDHLWDNRQWMFWTPPANGATGMINEIVGPVVAQVSVTFDANGGDEWEMSRIVAVGSLVGPLPKPTRSGYSFAGWWTSASGGTQISASTTVFGNVTYYARWTANGGGSGGSPGTIVASAPVPLSVEAGNVLHMTFSRVGGNKGSIAVKAKTQTSTALMGTNGSADFDYIKTVMTWADGDSSTRTIHVPTYVQPWEGTKMLRVKLSTLATGAYAGNLVPKLDQAKIYVDLENPSKFGTVSVEPLNAQPVAGQTLRLVFRRTGGNDWPIAVKYKVQTSTAVAGVDFEYMKDVLTWGDGEDGVQYVDVPTYSSGAGKQLRVKLSTLTQGAYEGCVTPHVKNAKVYVPLR